MNRARERRIRRAQHGTAKAGLAPPALAALRFLMALVALTPMAQVALPCVFRPGLAV